MSVCFGLCVYLPCQTRMSEEDTIVVIVGFDSWLSHLILSKSNLPIHSFGHSILYVKGWGFANISLQKGQWAELSPGHKVLTYLEYRAVSGVFRTIDPPPLSTQRVCPPPAPKAGDTHSPGGEGVGGQYFGRRQTVDWLQGLPGNCTMPRNIYSVQPAAVAGKPWIRPSHKTATKQRGLLYLFFFHATFPRAFIKF
jgi:hypothetical protein